MDPFAGKRPPTSPTQQPKPCAAATDAKPTGAGMPSFAWKMSDRQIAETLDFIRNSWGNAAKPVDEAEVARLRSVLSARDQLPAN